MNKRMGSRLFVGLISILLMLLLANMTIAEGLPILTLNESSVSVVKGKTVKVIPSVENVENPKKVKFTWSSSDGSVATVSNGAIRGVNGGTATITCTATLEDKSTITSDVSVSVVVPVASLKLSSTVSSFEVGKEYTIKTDVSPKDASNKTVTWSVADTSVATITNGGVLKIKKAGKTTVTATTTDGTNRTANLSVYVPSLKSGAYNVYVNNRKGNEYRLSFYGDSSYWARNISLQQKGDHSSYSTKVSPETNEVVFSFSPLYSGDDVIVVSDNNDRQSKVTLNVHVTDSAIAKQNGVIVSDIKLSQGRYNLNFKVQVKNLTQQTVTGVDFLVDYYDAGGYQRYCYSLYDKNQLEEFAFSYYSNIAPGKTATFNYNNNVFDSQSPVSMIEVAIAGYTLGNGTYVTIPDSQLRWYSSDSGYSMAAVSDAEYNAPSSSVFNKSGKFMIGFTSTPMYSYICKGFANSDYPGRFVTEVNEDSIAKKAGLLVKDVIYGIDDMLWKDEPNLVEIAKAKMYDGETVTLHIMRNNMKKDLKMAMNMEALEEPTATPTIVPEVSKAVADNTPKPVNYDNVVEITSASIENQADGSQFVRITCKNVIDIMIHDTTLTLCFLDENETIINILNSEIEAAIRPGKAVTLDVQIDESVNPKSVYVDQISYYDTDGNQYRMFVNKIKEVPLS